MACGIDKRGFNHKWLANRRIADNKLQNSVTNLERGSREISPRPGGSVGFPCHTFHRRRRQIEPPEWQHTVAVIFCLHGQRHTAAVCIPPVDSHRICPGFFRPGREALVKTLHLPHKRHTAHSVGHSADKTACATNLAAKCTDSRHGHIAAPASERHTTDTGSTTAKRETSDDSQRIVQKPFDTP